MRDSFPHLSVSDRLARLDPPDTDRQLAIVLDTDPYNEIDDQFAIVHVLLSPERLKLLSVYAAPFANARSDFDPRRGMETSFDTAKQVLSRVHVRGVTAPNVFHGATRFATDVDDPSGFRGQAVESDAVTDIIERARKQPHDEPLIIVEIAAITNVASAILLAPEIVDKIVVLWLGGHPHNHYDTDEFNLRQDPFAARVVLDSGVPLVLFPCFNVAEHLILTSEDVRSRVAGKGEIGDYLASEYEQYTSRERRADSRPIWDMLPIAWLIEPKWVDTFVIPTPVLGTSPLKNDGYRSPHLDRTPNADGSRRAHCAWSLDPRRHLMREAFRVRRDAVFADFYAKLDAHAAASNR